MTGAVLSASHLHRFFHAGDEEVQALRDVSLEVHTGELVVVTGPSGSGKSTLVACLCGLDEPDGGTVRVGGQRLSRRTERERAALGLLLQAGNLSSWPRWSRRAPGAAATSWSRPLRGCLRSPSTTSRCSARPASGSAQRCWCRGWRTHCWLAAGLPGEPGTPAAGPLSEAVAGFLSRQHRLLSRGILMVALASAFAVSTSVFDTQHRNAYVGAAVVLTLRSSGSSLIERLRRP